MKTPQPTDPRGLFLMLLSVFLFAANTLIVRAVNGKLELIAGIDGVRVAPVLTGQVILTFAGKEKGVAMNGVVPEMMAGLLPLVLERTHVSSYRSGRYFGPSWSSTSYPDRCSRSFAFPRYFSRRKFFRYGWTISSGSSTLSIALRHGRRFEFWNAMPTDFSGPVTGLPSIS